MEIILKEVRLEEDPKKESVEFEKFYDNSYREAVKVKKEGAQSKLHWEATFYIEDEDEAEDLINHWEVECSGAVPLDIGDWEGDSYYDRADSEAGTSEYSEAEGFNEFEEDVDSFITGLMD